MRFLNASVLPRKAQNRNLSWGFPLGNLLPKTRVLKHRVLECKRRPNANASVLGTPRFRTLSLFSRDPCLTPPPRICVKWVPFVKLAFSLGNRAHFASKMGLFSAFSHYIFNDCGPNRGFHSDFALSRILAL